MTFRHRLVTCLLALVFGLSALGIDADTASAAKPAPATMAASCGFNNSSGSYTWNVNWNWNSVYVNYVWFQVHFSNGGRTYGYNVTEASRSGSNARSSTYSADPAYVILNMYDRSGNLIQSFAPLCF